MEIKSLLNLGNRVSSSQTELHELLRFLIAQHALEPFALYQNPVRIIAIHNKGRYFREEVKIFNQRRILVEYLLIYR